VSGKTLYVVQRVVRGPYVDGGVAVRAFTTRAKADALRKQLEDEARRTLSPAEALAHAFYCERAKVEERLRKLGLAPPTIRRGQSADAAVGAWWRELLPSLTPEVRAKLWSAAGAPEFYEVVTTKLERD
jgi:hypothetical protein